MSLLKDYPAILSIRYFAAGLLFYLVLGMIPMFHILVKPENIVVCLQLVGFTLAIPFIFSLNFAVKCQTVKDLKDLKDFKELKVVENNSQ